MQVARVSRGAQVDLDAVADELYGLRPEDFTAARDQRSARARADGDRGLAKKIGELRRPSLSAWASNLLVRHRPDEVEAVIRLGEGLRRAHHDLDRAQLRDLVLQQRTVVNALSRQARQLAAQNGHPIGEDARREVEATLHAVLADPDAARQWAAGRLVKPLSAAAGFPAVGSAALRSSRAGSVATSPPPAPETRKDRAADREARERLTQARKGAKDAERQLRARRDEAATAIREADEAQRRLDEAQRHVRDLTEELKRAEDELRRARTTRHRAKERAGECDRAVREARLQAEEAAVRAQQLERHGRDADTGA